MKTASSSVSRWSGLRYAIILSLLMLIATGEVKADCFGKVVGVSDGDTITVLCDGRPVRVRMNQIDAPEKAQAFGQRSKQHLSGMIFGRSVQLKGLERDRYGRLLASVWLDGRDINREMVSAGMAWVYRQYSTDRSYLDNEADARRMGLGLWQAHAVPPWEFRRR